jgi:hypothetical protein
LSVPAPDEEDRRDHVTGATDIPEFAVEDIAVRYRARRAASAPTAQLIGAAARLCDSEINRAGLQDR